MVREARLSEVRPADDEGPFAFAAFDATHASEPLAPAALLPGGIDVWGFSLAANDEESRAWADLLDADERLRCERFLRGADRRAFIVAHAVLRRIVSAYVGGEAAALRILADGDGKPRLAHTSAALHFSLAHAAGVALLAIGERPLGVDLEHERGDFVPLDLADRFFSPHERARLRALAPEARMEAFLRQWVAKEAVLKADGQGLRFPLEHLTIEIDGETASVADGAATPQRLRDWHVRMLALPHGWQGAVASAARGEVRLRRPPPAAQRSAS